MIKFVYCLAALVALALACPKICEDDSHRLPEDRRKSSMFVKRLIYEVDLDKFIDNNHEGISDALLAIDPTESVDRTYKFAGVTTIQLSRGQIQNLALFKRTGKCNMRYSEKRLNINLTIGWEKLNVDYRYDFKKVLLPTSHGDLHIGIHDSSIDLIMEFNFEDYTLRLIDIAVLQARTMDLKVEGSWSDVVTNILLRFFPKSVLVPEIKEIATILINRKLEIVNKGIQEVLTSKAKQPQMIEMFLSTFRALHQPN